MIRYSLTKNTMNPDSNGYIAKIKQLKKTGLDEILDHMTDEGTGLTRPQALAYFEKLIQTFEYFIEERGSVNTPLCCIQTSITGIFRDKQDTFDPKRHHIHLRIKPGIRLKNLKQRLKLQKEERPEQAPCPGFFLDIASKTFNETVTPQSIATLQGKNLKFDSEDLEQGIFFIPEDSSKSTVRVNAYSSITTTEVHFLIPSMPPGNYTVLIKSIMRRHTSIRSGILQPLVTVY